MSDLDQLGRDFCINFKSPYMTNIQIKANHICKLIESQASHVFIEEAMASLVLQLGGRADILSVIPKETQFNYVIALLARRS